MSKEEKPLVNALYLICGTGMLTLGAMLLQADLSTPAPLLSTCVLVIWSVFFMCAGMYGLALGLAGLLMDVE